MQKSKCSTIGRHRTQIFSHQPLSKEKKKSKITIRTSDMRFFEHIHVHVLYLHFFVRINFTSSERSGSIVLCLDTTEEAICTNVKMRATVS